MSRLPPPGISSAGRLADSQQWLTKGGQEAGSIEPRTEQEQEDRSRLRHTAALLHRRREEARMELGRTQAALMRAGSAAREAAPADGQGVQAVHADLLHRTRRTASLEGHRIDEAVWRASSQTSTVLAVADSASQAARERMRSHRDAGRRRWPRTHDRAVKTGETHAQQRPLS